MADVKRIVNKILEGVSVREAMMQATIKDPATGKYVDVDFENPWEKGSKTEKLPENIKSLIADRAEKGQSVNFGFIQFKEIVHTPSTSYEKTDFWSDSYLPIQMFLSIDNVDFFNSDLYNTRLVKFNGQDSVLVFAGEKIILCDATLSGDCELLGYSFDFKDLHDCRYDESARIEFTVPADIKDASVGSVICTSVFYKDAMKVYGLSKDQLYPFIEMYGKHNDFYGYSPDDYTYDRFLDDDVVAESRLSFYNYSVDGWIKPIAKFTWT